MLLARQTLANLCRARERLREMDEHTPPIAELAREAAMSPFHFIRRFEAVFGTTPHQFRVAARLDRAKQLLASDRHSVTAVCMEVGFSSVGSFSDLFKRKVGVCPSAYRRSSRAFVQVPG